MSAVFSGFKIDESFSEAGGRTPRLRNNSGAPGRTQCGLGKGESGATPAASIVPNALFYSIFYFAL